MWIKKALSLILHRCRNAFRAAGAVCATSLFRSHRRRWAKVGAAGRPAWDRRNEIIASQVPPCSSVLDLGAGAQTLRVHLHPSCKYQACDLFKTSREVILCDFNAGQYPTLTDRYSHVVCSGVLEYIRDPRAFLRNVSQYGDELLLSYNPMPRGGSKIRRMTNSWCSHLSREQLELLFAEVGLTSEVVNESQRGELVYRLKPAGGQMQNSQAQ